MTHRLAEVSHASKQTRAHHSNVMPDSSLVSLEAIGSALTGSEVLSELEGNKTTLQLAI